MTVSCMHNENYAIYPYYRNSCIIVGQIPRSTERISSISITISHGSEWVRLDLHAGL